MACKLEILNEEWMIEAKKGNISSSLLEKIAFVANNKNCLILPFINGDKESIFNILQLEQIKNELSLIESELISFNQNELKILIGAIDEVIKEKSYTYLRVTCT